MKKTTVPSLRKSAIGIALAPWVKKGAAADSLLAPSMHGLEQRLVIMHDNGAGAFLRPGVVIVDPTSNLTLDCSHREVKFTLMRRIDFLKQQHITSVPKP